MTISWSVIRAATAEDCERLDRAACRFCQRHNLQSLNYIPDNPDASDGGEYGRYLLRLWTACAHRALRHRWATGIMWGTVGFTVD